MSRTGTPAATGATARRLTWGTDRTGDNDAWTNPGTWLVRTIGRTHPQALLDVDDTARRRFDRPWRLPATRLRSTSHQPKDRPASGCGSTTTTSGRTRSDDPTPRPVLLAWQHSG